MTENHKTKGSNTKPRAQKTKPKKQKSRVIVINVGVSISDGS
jgi:hypothetical protein